MTDTDALDAGLLAVADAVMDKAEAVPTTWRQYRACRGLRKAILTALRAERVRGEESMRERAKANLRKWLDRNHASLHAGEFSAQEWKTLRAVLSAVLLETAALPTTDQETTHG